MCMWVFNNISINFNDKYIPEICMAGYKCTHTSSSEDCRFIPKAIPISPEMAAFPSLAADPVAA